MKRSTLVLGVAIAGGLFSLGGCLAVLGDFTASADVPTDGGPTDSGPVADALPTSDAPGSLPLMKCILVGTAATLTDLGALASTGVPGGTISPKFNQNNGNDGPRVMIQRASVGKTDRDVLRVLFNVQFTPTAQGSRDVPMLVSVRFDGANKGVRSTLYPELGQLQDITLLPGGDVAVISTSTQNAGGVTTTNLYATTLPGAYLGDAAGTRPTPVLIGPNVAGSSQNRLVATAYPYTDTDFFYASTSSPVNNMFQLVAGHGTATGPYTVVPSTAEQRKADSPMIVAGTKSNLIFTSGDPTQGDSVYYTLTPDGKPVAGATQAVTVGTGKNTFGLAVGGTRATANIAVAEVDLAATSNVLTVRLGRIDTTKFDGFNTSKLNKSKSFDSPSDAPVQAGASHWSGDEFGMIGSGVNSADGVNFLWVNADGVLRSDQTGNARLFKDQKILSSNIGLGQVLGPTIANWDVVWTESGGSGDRVMYQSLGCSPK